MRPLYLLFGLLVLGAAGILAGKPATTHWTVQSSLPAFGAEPRREDRIVRDGKVATAAGVSAGLDLGLWLVGEIAGRDHAEMVQLYIEYDPQPPYDSGHPSKARKEITDRAFKLSRKIAFTPSQMGAVAVVAWRQTLSAFRNRRK